MMMKFMVNGREISEGMRFPGSVVEKVLAFYDTATATGDYYVVGGAVTDLVFGIEEHRDIDLYVKMKSALMSNGQYIFKTHTGQFRSTPELEELRFRKLIQENTRHFLPGITGYRDLQLSPGVPLRVDIFMHVYGPEKYVKSYFDLDINTMYYSRKDGLVIPLAAQKALQNMRVGFNHHIIRPTILENERMASAKRKYGLN
jgi:hypothetical protein